MTKTISTTILGLSLLAGLGAGCVVGGSDAETGGNDENIIGGTIDNGDPSVVALLIFKADGGVSLCTGTVIAPTKVLTAAHCVDPRLNGAGATFEVRTGTDITAPTAKLAVARTAFDPAFDATKLNTGHDIAIVTLAVPTSLAPLPFSRGGTVGGTVRIVGYGMNTHVVNPYVPSGAGTKRTSNVAVNSASNILINLGDSFHQTCHGDSGGPAFQNIGGREVLVGVTSYGSDLSANTVCFYGGTDTRVDAYSAFIDANM